MRPSRPVSEDGASPPPTLEELEPQFPADGTEVSPADLGADVTGWLQQGRFDGDPWASVITPIDAHILEVEVKDAPMDEQITLDVAAHDAVEVARALVAAYQEEK